jgi:hypothetical protein
MAPRLRLDELVPEQRETWFSLELVLQEAFQVLVLTRMLIRRESEYKGATKVLLRVPPLR